MVVRDKDVLRDVSKQASCTVCVSVPSVDEHAWEKMEPGTAPPLQRLRAVRELCDAGVRAGVLMAPIVPGISSQPSKIERTIKAISDHGAAFVGANVLHLEGGTRDHFMKFLSADTRSWWRDTAGYTPDARTRRTASGTKSARWCRRSRRSTASPSGSSMTPRMPRRRPRLNRLRRNNRRCGISPLDENPPRDARDAIDRAAVPAFADRQLHTLVDQPFQESRAIGEAVALLDEQVDHRGVDLLVQEGYSLAYGAPGPETADRRACEAADAGEGWRGRPDLSRHVRRRGGFWSRGLIPQPSGVRRSRFTRGRRSASRALGEAVLPP